MKTTIIGGGLVGSLWALYLAKAGYEVSVFERRLDMRKAQISAGKSINLAMSNRGWKALDDIGAGDAIRQIAIPMYGRAVHDLQGNVTFQPYSIDNQAIFSVSRADINCTLMDLAEKQGNAKFYFEETCQGVDLSKNRTSFKNNITGALKTVESDVVFATDGAFSAVRYHSFQKQDRFDFSQRYIEDGYREILLPANEDGTHKLRTNALHIWPRGRFMLIALPNFDGSYTCTLFMPFENHEHCFNNLTSKEKVTRFFQELFPDFYEIMPYVADSWDEHPLSSLAIIRCYPWVYGKTALLGDAAHATVPFYGQGMNCGFEDCTVLWQLMQEHDQNWDTILNQYQTLRKPNGDAVQDLSLHNYLVMRDKVADPDFLLQQRIERRIQHLYPQHYLPLYSMVTFSTIEYQTALQKGMKQEADIQKIINDYSIQASTSADEIDNIIHQIYSNK